MRLREKVAFVTGASRGIGAAISGCFAREGARVCLAARSSGPIEALAASLRDEGREAMAATCDVTRKDSFDAALRAAVDAWGRIDILVNNAGTSGLTPLEGEENPEETWNEILETNLTAAFRVSRAALPFMPDGSRIINQSSVLGRFGVPGYAAYVASKHGMIGLTRTMALELAPRRITVNAICPGWVETELGRAGFGRIARNAGVSLEGARSMAARMAPLGRVLEPEEIAGLAVYIASEEAGNLTGQAIVLDGGQVMP
jgi:NAD(P)-dependent dehydrogenase (short-subunit alcohol dehydrogenase family)